MKKNLLIATALLVSAVASAQSVVWKCWADAEGHVEKTATVSGSETFEASDVTLGSGVEFNTSHQGTHKDASGASLNYYEDGYQVAKIYPVSADAIKDIAEAYSASQYVEFGVSEKDVAKYLELSGIKLNVVRFGTDAVRVNVKLLADTDDGDYETDWLLQSDNWSAIANGDGSWDNGESEGSIWGYAPARENGSVDLDFDGWSSLNIPVPANFPSNAYQVKLQVVVYGIANNKQFGLGDVTLNFGGGETGIQNIQTVESADAPVYNLAGQRVSKETKGLLIQNGKKFINK